MQVHVLPVAWETHSKILEAIRAAVFIEEQGVPASIERDGKDEQASHFLAISQAGQHVGCARLLADGQIARVAVEEQRETLDATGSPILRRIEFTYHLGDVG